MQLELFSVADLFVSAELPDEWFLPLEWLEIDGICARFVILSYLVPDRYLARIEWSVGFAVALQSRLLERTPNGEDAEQITGWKEELQDLQKFADEHQAKLAAKRARKVKRLKTPTTDEPIPLRIPAVGLLGN